MKKWISGALLAFCLVFVLFAVTPGTRAYSDGNESQEPKTMVVGETYAEHDDDFVYRFVPEESGAFTFFVHEDIEPSWFEVTCDGVEVKPTRWWYREWPSEVSDDDDEPMEEYPVEFFCEDYTLTAGTEYLVHYHFHGEYFGVVRFNPLVITQQPSRCVVNYGENVTFMTKAEGTGMAYEWEFSRDGGKTWNYHSRGRTLSLTANYEDSNTQYRCKISSRQYSMGYTDPVAYLFKAELNKMLEGDTTFLFVPEKSGVYLVYLYGAHPSVAVTCDGTELIPNSSETIKDESGDFKTVNCTYSLTAGKEYLVRTDGLDDDGDGRITCISYVDITRQPEDYVGAEDSPVTFRVEAVGEGLTYQWQYSDNGGKKWTTSSVKTAEYPTMLAANRDGRLIRCIVTDQYGNTVTSDTATMKLYRLAITKQPENYVGAEDSPVTFRVEAIGDGLSYKWQFSDNGGKKWTTSSIKTAEYPTLLAANRDGRLIRCIVKDQYGNSVASDVVTMRLNKAAITKQPENYVGAVDSPVTFTVEATGDGLTYKWQFSDNGGAKWTTSSIKTAEYPTLLAANRDGRLIRCIVKDQYGNSVASDVVTMRLNKAAITKQPENYVGEENSQVTFRVEAIGDGLTYKWQFSDNGGKMWTTSSIKTAEYPTLLAANRDGRQIRCIVTDQYGNSVTSNVVTMRLNKLAITKQPADYVGKVNSTASFTVEAIGPGLTYRWQFSDNGGQKWTTSNVTAQIYSAKLTSIKNGRLVRCIITDANGNSVTSGAARMTIG